MNLGKNILLQGVKIMMSNRMMSAVLKGMLVGAVIGGGAAYISGIDLTCKCRQMKKTAGKAYKGICKTINKAVDKVM